MSSQPEPGAPAVDVSILMVGYNSRRFLSQAIGSVAVGCSRHTYEIVFINNGTDDSEQFIDTSFPAVKVLETCGNVGFAEGNNKLAERAVGKWLLLLNPDTRLHPEAIDRLLEVARRHPDFGILVGLTVDENGRPHVQARAQLPTVATFIRGMVGKAGIKDTLDSTQDVHEVEAVNGGFMLIDRACWDRLGGLDRSFFLYGEELDFCFRAKAAGYRIGIVPQSKIFHDLGSGDNHSSRRSLMIATGMAQYGRKHLSAIHSRLFIFTLWLTCLVRMVACFPLGMFAKRYLSIARSLTGVVFHPSKWVRGFASAGADPRPTSSALKAQASR